MLNRIKEIEAAIKKLSQEVENIKSEASFVKLSSLKQGDVFKIAEKEFIVLEHTVDGTKVISKDLWGKSIKFGNNRNYKESKVKKFIEENVLPEIEKCVGKENIIEHEVDLTSMDGSNEFGSCFVKVRPITFLEARKYTNLIENEKMDDWYWTCSPWSSGKRGHSYGIAVVSPGGDIDSLNCNDNNGVRPFCILKSDIFVSLM